jgi:bacterioferritin
VRAEAIKEALAADIQEELGHAQQLGNRIKTAWTWRSEDMT